MMLQMIALLDFDSECKNRSLSSSRNTKLLRSYTRQAILDAHTKKEKIFPAVKTARSVHSGKECRVRVCETAFVSNPPRPIANEYCIKGKIEKPMLLLVPRHKLGSLLSTYHDRQQYGQ